MIQYRHHVVSLFAVFLALAVGVVLGGGPLTEVGRGALASDAPARDTSEPGNDGAAKFGDAFALASADALYDDRLAGRPVAVVVLPGADEQVVAGMRDQVERAAGTIAATWSLTPGLVDPTEKSLVDTLGSQLVTQLGAEAADADAPTYERMGQLLGRAVASTNADGQAVDEDAAAVRQSLVAADLVVGPDGDPRRAPLVLVALGDDVDDDILAGLLTGLGGTAVGVVAAGSTAAGENGDIAALREEQGATEVATVDGSERAPGQVAAALALIRSLQRPGGSFGASGADGAAPLG